MNALTSAPVTKRAITNSDGRLEEIWALPKDTASLTRLFTDLFENHYDQLVFGPIIPGAAYEMRCAGKPKRIDFSGGYLTVHWGRMGGHFHMCLGVEPMENETPAMKESRLHRSPGRIELYRRMDKDGVPITWGVRMFNGKNEPMIEIFLPNPYVTADDDIVEIPDWSRLTLWEDILRRYTGNEPDGRDRESRGFANGNY